MTYLVPLAALNNAGVRHYEQGRLYEAKDCFQMCIDEMLKLILQLNQERTEQDDMAVEEDTTDEEAILDEREMSDEYEMSDEEDTSDEEDSLCSSAPHPSHYWSNLNQEPAHALPARHNSLIQGWSNPLPYTSRPGQGVFVFSRAIFLQESPETNGEASSSPEQTFAGLCIQKLAIQFNKALTHHQISNSTVKSTYYSEDSEMAFHMYEQAFRSLKSEINGSDDGDTCNSMCTRLDRDILKLALFNNMGVIFCNDLGRFSDACECFKASCGVMLGLVDDPSCCLRQILDGDEMYLLSMNIWMAPQTVTPAA